MNNYLPLYEIAASLIPQESTVFELGCGDGEFARMIKSKCWYTGFDIDSEAITKARLKNPELRNRFMERDITKTNSGWNMHAGTYVALEVLEHLKDDKDLSVLSLIRRACRVIISVPSFDSSDHQRYFPDEWDAIERYAGCLNIDLWRKISLPTGGGYFHLMRGFR